MLRGYKFKEIKHDTDLERDLQQPREEVRRSIGGGGRERLPLVDRAVFFFFYDRLTTLDLRFFLWK